MADHPDPNATYAEVQAWYAEHGVEPSDGEEWHSFAGADDCDEECKGWDGESYRCQCGNRRVYWDTSEGGRFARAD